MNNIKKSHEFLTKIYTPRGVGQIKDDGGVLQIKNIGKIL
jgi:hypothetical protein